VTVVPTTGVATVNAPSSHITYTQGGTGATSRTVTSKLQESVSVLDFGADPTGVADSTAAIQAAINSCKPSVDTYPQTGWQTTSVKKIYFPAGNYTISSPLQVYSFQYLYGDNIAPTIQAGGGFSGAALITLNSVSPGTTNQYALGCIEGINFSGNVTAIAQNVGTITNSIFRRLAFACSVCLKLDSYTQTTIIDGILAAGTYTNQILSLKGNFNRISNIDKEGSTGSTTDSYILIQNATFPSEGNDIRGLVIEGTCSANKTPVSLIGCTNTTIDEFWFEAGPSTGYAISINNCQNIKFKGIAFVSNSTVGKVTVSNNSTVYFETFTSSADDVDFQTYFTVDATSNVRISTNQSRRMSDQLLLSQLPTLWVDEMIDNNLLATPNSGISPICRPDYFNGQNLLVNPSFEAGIYGWSWSSTPATVEFIASEVGQGLMLHGNLGASGSPRLYQNISVSAAQVGKPFTLRALVKLTNAGFAVPVVAGASSTGDYRVNANSGWATLTCTVYPTAAGSVNFGIWFVSVTAATDFYVDDMTVSIGTQAPINPSKFGSFELNTKTFTTGTAAPATGTWIVGSRVFNSAPAVGSPKSWVCTVAGTPGTWVSEGNL